MSLARIANPIYDAAFKYLLDDNRVARVFLSTLIGEEIIELTLRPTEHHADLEQRNLTVFRMDFAAKIALAGGEEKLILVEIQKAKFASDIMRFRKYLGQQYASPANSYEHLGRERALPIHCIYFLGHSLERTKAPVIRVRRSYVDVFGGVEISEREEFIESLTHDSLLVQIPFLPQRRQSELECLLGLFDQSQKDPSDAHVLSVREEDYPEKFRDIIRRLIRAVSEPQIRQTMDIEDEVLHELEDLERRIAKQAELIAAKEAALEEKEAALVAKNSALNKAIALLVASGISEAEARAQLGM